MIRRVLIAGKGNTANLGINKFKREQSKDFKGHYNPKHKSVRGDVLRDLKAEAWEELHRRLNPVTKETAKRALGK